MSNIELEHLNEEFKTYGLSTKANYKENIKTMIDMYNLGVIEELPTHVRDIVAKSYGVDITKKKDGNIILSTSNKADMKYANDLTFGELKWIK